MDVCCGISSPWFPGVSTVSVHVQSRMRTDAGRSLDFKCPDEVGNSLHAVFKAPALQAVDNLLCGARVPEICRANFHRGGARKHELHYIFRCGDSAHADDGDFHGVRSFIYHAQSDWLDGGAAQA